MIVKVQCTFTCSVPSLGVIANIGEVREVSEEAAEILVGTGKFVLLESADEDEPQESAVEPDLTVLKDLGAKSKKALNDANVHTLTELLAVDPQELSAATSIKLAKIEEWRREAVGLIQAKE